jgi:hypothetical protein
MPLLHDPAVRSSLEARLKSMRPDSPRQWGIMSSGQMLWHVNQFLAYSMGEDSSPPQKSSMPAPLMRFLIGYMPWPKNAPTNPATVPGEDRDFEAERARCLGLIDRFVNRPIDGQWPVDPVFGQVTGKFASRLHARHLDHHFRQFGS